MAYASAFLGQLVRYNDAGVWSAGIVVNVRGDSLVDLLEFTAGGASTLRSNVPLNETGNTSTAQPRTREY